MKLLIFKTDHVLSADDRHKIVKDLHTGIADGVLFIDGTYTYEVVEFDSINFNNSMLVTPKEKMSRRDLIRRNEDWKRMREAFAEARRKGIEYAVKGDKSMTYSEKKKQRCKKCKYSHIESRPEWGWPCDECQGATATLGAPKKDYFEEATDDVQNS